MPSGLPFRIIRRLIGQPGTLVFRLMPALRNILRPANNNEVEAPKRRSARKTLLAMAREAFEAGDYPTANALARRVQKNNSLELAAYAIIALTETDDFERRWVLLKGERAAQKLITSVPISQPGFMAPQHFSHFATNRSLLARDYWRAGPGRTGIWRWICARRSCGATLKIPMACALTIMVVHGASCSWRGGGHARTAWSAGRSIGGTAEDDCSHASPWRSFDGGAFTGAGG
jgi:hypothetical protein